MQNLTFDLGFGKNGWIGVLFPFSSQVKTPLVFMNFDIWFSERAQGLKWRALTEKYLKQPLKLNNFYVLKFSNGTTYSLTENLFWFKFN